MDFIANEAHSSRKYVIADDAVNYLRVSMPFIHTLTIIAHSNQNIYLQKIHRLNYVQTNHDVNWNQVKSRPVMYKFMVNQCNILNIHMQSNLSVQTTSCSIKMIRDSENFQLLINESIRSLFVVASHISKFNLIDSYVTHLKLRCNDRINLSEILKNSRLTHVCILCNAKFEKLNHAKYKSITLPYQLQHLICNEPFENVRCNVNLKSLHVWRCNSITQAEHVNCVIHIDKTREAFIEHFKF